MKEPELRDLGQELVGSKVKCRKMRHGKTKLDLKPTIKIGADMLHHIRFLLTGSEVTLLEEYLDTHDPEGVLYGRGRMTHTTVC